MLIHAHGSPSYLHLILYPPCHRVTLPTCPLNLFPLVPVSPCPRVPSTLFGLTSWGVFFAGIAAELNLVPAPSPFLTPEERSLTHRTDLRRQVFFFYSTHSPSVIKICSFANRLSQQKGVRLRRRSLTPVNLTPTVLAYSVGTLIRYRLATCRWELFRSYHTSHANASLSISRHTDTV